MQCLFAHGFEGHPQGPKKRYLESVLGWSVTAPPMHRHGWTLDGHVRTLLECLDAQPDIQWVVGSSFGGFAAAVALSQRTSRPLKLILLAPAITFADVLSDRLGKLGLDAWKETRRLPYMHHGVGQQIELPYELWSQCDHWRQVHVVHPCVIIHGVRDDVIPIDGSRSLRDRSPGVIQLIETDDSHRLSSSLTHMEQAAKELMTA